MGYQEEEVLVLILLLLLFKNIYIYLGLLKRGGKGRDWNRWD